MKKKHCISKRKAGGSGELKAAGGYPPRQHQDVVAMGQGPTGNVAAIVPWGSAPPVPAPPVGAGKGFKGI